MAALHALLCLAALQVQASRLFGLIRQTVACQAAPATLKSAFLEPLSTQLAAELSVEMFGRTDEDFMALFTGEWDVVGWGSRATACCSPVHPWRPSHQPYCPATLQPRACFRRWRPAGTDWPSGWRAWCAARTSSASWRAACSAEHSTGARPPARAPGELQQCSGKGRESTALTMLVNFICGPALPVRILISLDAVKIAPAPDSALAVAAGAHTAAGCGQDLGSAAANSGRRVAISVAR